MKGPIRGTLFDTEVHKDGVALDARSFCNLAVEAEMGIKIGAQGQILSVFPVIELHNFIFRGPKKSLSELIANNGLNKGMVLSKKSWEKMPEMYKENSVLSLEINGSVVDSGNLWPMDGGPLSSLSWLNANLAKYGLKYCGENIILGGTALGLYHIKPGDTVDVKVNGQSAVKCFVS
jgi:2-keto-4-pentenoate hydratase